jgi:sec-independent protein translocase protein TatB
MDLFSSVGSQEILMILLVALIIIGPTKIAEFGKTVGNVSRNLKKASTDFTTNLNREIEQEVTQQKKQIMTAVNGKPEESAVPAEPKAQEKEA